MQEFYDLNLQDMPRLDMYWGKILNPLKNFLNIHVKSRYLQNISCHFRHFDDETYWNTNTHSSV